MRYLEIKEVFYWSDCVGLYVLGGLFVFIWYIGRLIGIFIKCYDFLEL